MLRRVNIGHASRGVLLLATLHRKSELGCMVRSLRTFLTFQDSSAKGLLALLDYMPNVTELGFCIHHLRELRQSPQWHNVTSLHLMMPKDVNIPRNYADSDEFPPRLETLTLYGRLSPGYKDLSWRSIFLPRLRTLVIYQYYEDEMFEDEDEEEGDHDVKMCNLPQAPQLQYITVHLSDADSEQFCRLVGSIKCAAGTLIALRVDNECHYRTLYNPDLLPFLTKLEMLEFSGFIKLPDNVSALSLLPPSVHYLHIDSADLVELGCELLRDFENGKTLPNLKALPELALLNSGERLTHLVVHGFERLLRKGYNTFRSLQEMRPQLKPRLQFRQGNLSGYRVPILPLPFEYQSAFNSPVREILGSIQAEA